MDKLDNVQKCPIDEESKVSISYQFGSGNYQFGDFPETLETKVDPLEHVLVVDNAHQINVPAANYRRF